MFIPNDALRGPTLHFIESSPLDACTTVGYDGGAMVARPDRPLGTLSTSEQALWRVLESLTGGDLRALLVVADTGTRAALADLFTRITLEAVA